MSPAVLQATPVIIMLIRILQLSLLTFTLNLLLSLSVNSQEIDLNIYIEGQGQVSVEGSNLSCTKTCTVKVNIDQHYPLILRQQAGQDSSFHHWSSDSCDSGEGAIFSNDLILLTSAIGGAKTILLEDFNGDTLVDAATLELFNGKLSVLLNAKTKRFSHHVTVAETISYPSAMAGFDWDADGDLDLLVVAHGAAEILVYLNDGNAQFKLERQIKIEGLSPYAIAVADINIDGRPDLLLSSFHANLKGDLGTLIRSIENADLSWFTQNTKGEFQHYQTLSETEGVITLDVADIDQDGDVDALAASITSDQAIIFWNEGTQTSLQTVAKGSGMYGVALGDIDKNGRLDVVAASYWDEKLEFSLQSTKREFTATKMLNQFANGVSAVDIADIDEDGKLDVASGVFNDQMFYWLKNDTFEKCVISKPTNRKVSAQFITLEKKQAISAKALDNLAAAQKVSHKQKIDDLKKSHSGSELDTMTGWMDLLTEGNYHKACQLAGATMDRSPEQMQQCQASLKSINDTMGKALSRSFIGVKRTHDSLAGERGEFISALYEVLYEKDQNGNPGNNRPVIVKLTMQKVENMWRMRNFEFL
jgi:hypothetical protein